MCILCHIGSVMSSLYLPIVHNYVHYVHANVHGDCTALLGQFARDGIRYLLTPLLIFLALSILFHNVRTRLPFVCPVLDHYTMPNHAIGGATAGPTCHWGHDPSTARGRFAAPPPPPRPRCTRGVPLGRWGALGAAMRGHGHVYHDTALILLRG